LPCGTARAALEWPSCVRRAAPLLPPRPTSSPGWRRRSARTVPQPQDRNDNYARAVPQLQDHDHHPSPAVPRPQVRSGRLPPAPRMARTTPARLWLWSAPCRLTGARLKSTSCAGWTARAPEDLAYGRAAPASFPPCGAAHRAVDRSFLLASTGLHPLKGHHLRRSPPPDRVPSDSDPPPSPTSETPDPTDGRRESDAARRPATTPPKHRRRGQPIRGAPRPRPRRPNDPRGGIDWVRRSGTRSAEKDLPPCTAPVGRLHGERRTASRA
jgi:hypothetical protein